MPPGTFPVSQLTHQFHIPQQPSHRQVGELLHRQRVFRRQGVKPVVEKAVG